MLSLLADFESVYNSTVKGYTIPKEMEMTQTVTLHNKRLRGKQMSYLCEKLELFIVECNPTGISVIIYLIRC
jgi:hypothetical protein